MWKIGILGYSFQSSHYEGVLSGIMLRMGILGYSFQSSPPGEGAQWHYVENGLLGYSRFNPSTMMGCSVALCGNRHFGLLFSIPPPGEGPQWHYVENGHFGLLFSIPPPGEGAQRHYAENWHFGCYFQSQPGGWCSVALCGELAFWPTPFNRPPIEDSMYVVFFGRNTFCSTHFQFFLHNGVLFSIMFASCIFINHYRQILPFFIMFRIFLLVTFLYF